MGIPGTLMESNGFDQRTFSNGPVTQLQWLTGMSFISASTSNSVSFDINFLGGEGGDNNCA